jgi:hypothetical protein
MICDNPIQDEPPTSSIPPTVPYRRTITTQHSATQTGEIVLSSWPLRLGVLMGIGMARENIVIFVPCLSLIHDTGSSVPQIAPLCSVQRELPHSRKNQLKSLKYIKLVQIDFLDRKLRNSKFTLVKVINV